MSCSALVMLIAVPRSALADTSASEFPSEPASTAVPQPVSVKWDESWRRVAPWEYAATAGVLTGAVALRFFGPEPPDNFRGGILFDDAVGDRSRVENPTLSGHVATMTDVLYLGSMGYRLIDSVVVPSVGYGNYDLANQMFMTDLESFSFVAGVLFGVQVFVGRQRPEYDRDCDGSVSSTELRRCQQQGSRFRSFIAGHPAVALTAAGLTCTHHAHIPLYGGWGDTLACGLSIGAAAFTGAGRVLGGKHYPTDLVLGMGLGAFSGWVLPRLLRYGFSGNEQKVVRQASSRQPTVVLSGVHPWTNGSEYGLSATGLF